MRCPDCSKFVGMENGEPEITVEANIVEDRIHVSVEVHHTRNCADCGTELKSIDDTTEHYVALSAALEGATPEVNKILSDAASKGDLEVEAECDDGEADESGGGRYAKNIITVRCPVTLTLSAGETKHEHSVELTCENAAGAYDEC